MWLDPWDRQELAFVSHAHSDHFAAHTRIVASKATSALIESRFSGDFRLEPRMFGRPWTFEGHRLMLLPAGHTLGSAQIHITRLGDGATLLYTGDFKLRGSRTSENTRSAEADVLIMETTFGLPRHRFPSTTKVRNALVRFCRECLEDGETPVLLGYSLGKTQEILAQLIDAGFSFVLHSSCHEMTDAYAAQGVAFPPYERLGATTDVTGKVLIVPPSAARSQVVRRLRNRRLAMCTGWALTPGAKYRYQVDEVFPLSDHADYPELLEYVKLVNPKLVLTTHGYAAEFARDLRERGYEAWSLGADDQMEFSLGLGGGDSGPAEDGDEESRESTEPQSEFGRFVRTCDDVAHSAGRLRKIDHLAAYFRSLAHANQVAMVTRYFIGRATASREEQRLIGTGWAVIRMALLNVTGLGLVRYREIAAGQNDSGRTAYLMLLHGQKTAPRPISLDDVSTCLNRLMEARGPLAKSAVLEAYFRQMTPTEGSYLVKILTGDMRIGLKEGLLEEALAEAFDVEPDRIRETHMLVGELGETARLAAVRELDSASLTVFQPVKPMLASPEPDAQAIWNRLGPGEKQAAASPGDGVQPPPDEPPPQVWLEDKFDGIRAQLHKRGESVALYSRDSRSLALEFPDIVQPAARLADDVVLDGEIVGFSEGKKLDFFALQKRLGRREPDLFLNDDIPVKFIAFDVLWANGETLLHRPLTERRSALDRLTFAGPFERIDVVFAGSPLEIEAAFQAARKRGNEGLLAKDPASPYAAGRRGKSWLKLKKEFSTLDAVVVKVEQGHGKRSHVLSDYTFALRDTSDGTLKVIGKAYSGLTDLEIEELTAHFIAHTIDESPRVRTVAPNIVLEIAFDSVQASDRHNSGLALRFPRIKAIRRDKSVDDIDTLATARKLAGLSG